VGGDLRGGAELQPQAGRLGPLDALDGVGEEPAELGGPQRPLGGR
jgi:hypothetical protein